MTKVKDYIYKDISSVNENSTIYRVIRYMKLHRISAVPIVNQLGEYVGCISEIDILRASVPEYMKSLYSTSFMADLDRVSAHLKDILNEKAIKFSDKKYPYVSPNDSMSYAADLLYRSNRNMLPVVEGKTLIGLVTRIEILAASLND